MRNVNTEEHVRHRFPNANKIKIIKCKIEILMDLQALGGENVQKFAKGFLMCAALRNYQIYLLEI